MLIPWANGASCYSGVRALGLVAAVIAIGLAERDREAVMSLGELRDKGVVFVADESLHVVWNEGTPVALSADAQHVGDEVRFCSSSGMFESAAHGEKFDGRGLYYGGPARRGLDRYPVRVEGGAIFVDLEHPITGPPRGAGPVQEPKGRFCIPRPGRGDA